MTESAHYTDHLIAALRCLDDEQLRKLASGIMERLVCNPDKCKLTMDEKLAYVQRLKTECSACNGKGWFVYRNWREECQPCGGTGKINPPA